MLSLICQSSLMISSDIVKCSRKFLRGADFGADMPVYGTDAPHDGFGFGIIKMPTVPGQEIIGAMDGGYGKMKRIIQGLGRKGPPLEKRFGQRDDGFRDWQYGNTG